ncbi:metal ABC transporter substrate-binding protein [Halomonas sp. M1]|uniref:metal ABC transporter substrate-binding protein n=1 Tax=Halomonas sp. M1 TaxID=3035470 RepID=UPI002484F41F|nr:metal ABC transporter substrate-binding protein [Halomonas sp. M1]WFE71122.1 metal ABC transporter substrate-binding protein [Halomonas sp. M1]
MRLMLKRSVGALALTLLISLPFPALATLNIVATTASLGMLANEVGGDQVSVTVLAAPDRDAHYLDARPSFMAALRRADVLLEVGAGLEEGWLPAAQRGAANPAVNSGRDTHFVSANILPLRRSITMDGPNVGHVHAEGNPHFNVDPLRMATLGEALARRLAQLDPEHAEDYRSRADVLARALRDEAKELAAGVAEQRIVVYHEDLDYLEEWLPVNVVGYLEPAPGIPPGARHLRELVDELQGTAGRVLYANFQPARGAEFLQRYLAWPASSVPLEPQTPTLEGYLTLMRTWVDALEAR